MIRTVFEPEHTKQTNFGYHAKISPENRKKYQENILNLCKLMKEQKDVLCKLMLKEPDFIVFFENFIKKIKNGEIKKKKLLCRGKWSNNVISCTYSRFVKFLKKIKAGTADFNKNLYKSKIDRNVLDDCLKYINDNNGSDFFKTTYKLYFFYRNETANEITPFVISIATKCVPFNNSGTDIEDLIQSGLIGVLKGLELYDIDKDIKVTTYLDFWIKEVIQRYIKDDELIHIPENIRVIRKLALNLGYNGRCALSEKDINLINKRTKASSDLIKQVVYNQEIVNSIDDIAIESENSNNNKEVKDFLQDNDKYSLPENCLERNFLKDDILKVLDKLTKREKDIIINRFGLFDVNKSSLSEVGKKHNISRERTRQIEQKALRKIKKYLKQIGENYGKL